MSHFEKRRMNMLLGEKSPFSAAKVDPTVSHPPPFTDPPRSSHPPRARLFFDYTYISLQCGPTNPT